MTRPLDMTEIEPPQGFGDVPFSADGDPDFLRALFDSIPGRAVVVGVDFTYRYVNQEFLDFVGKPASEVVGRPAAEVLDPAVVESYMPLTERLFAGERLRWEGWADYGPLGRRYVQETISPWRQGDGPVAGFIAIGRDLTDLKRHEAELAERIAAHESSEAFNAIIVKSALDGIVVIDAEGMVVDFNPAAEAIFGYRRADVIGTPVADLIIPPDLRAAHSAGMARYLQGGSSRVIGRRLELEAMRADGARIPIELSITDVTREGRRLFAAHLRDLTAQKEADAEIERQRDALYQKEKLSALGSLLAGVAHELNNPLAIVLGQAALLREIIEEDEGALADRAAVAERCEKIENAANRCGRIVKSFLAMARQRKGERQQVAIRQLLTEVVELVGYNLRSSGIEVAIDVSPSLPPLIADRDHLHQVIVNLVVNAQQALEQVAMRNRAIRLTAELDRPAGQVVVTVADNGPGVPPAIRSRIFEPFFTTKPQGYGTGIGLAISRGLVEAEGGTLDLLDGPEGGAHFVIRLPAEGAQLAPAAPAAAPEAAPPRQRPRATVLVIDDEDDIVDLIADMLPSAEVACIRAGSGQAAVLLLERLTTPPAAIFCDIKMPDGDGPFVYAWLERHMPELTRRIAFVTGDALGPAAYHFLTQTRCPVLEKPFFKADIRALLDKLTA